MGKFFVVGIGSLWAVISAFVVLVACLGGNIETSAIGISTALMWIGGLLFVAALIVLVTDTFVMQRTSNDIRPVMRVIMAASLAGVLYPGYATSPDLGMGMAPTLMVIGAIVAIVTLFLIPSPLLPDYETWGFWLALSILNVGNVFVWQVILLRADWSHPVPVVAAALLLLLATFVGSFGASLYRKVSSYA